MTEKDVTEELGMCMQEEDIQIKQYSGYIDHSDFWICPHNSWEEAFEFLKQLACESDEEWFCVGELRKEKHVFGLKNVKNYKWNWVDEEWELEND